MNATTTPETNVTNREQLLTDILTTAVEGGINYWAPALAYQHSGPVADRGVTLLVEDVDAQDFIVPLLDPAEFLKPEFLEDEDTNVVRVTLDHIRKGLNLIVSNDDSIRLRDDIVAIIKNANRQNDAAPDNESSPGDIDAEVASCILQAGIFGEVVFS
mgnify:CR=1 FL=1